MDRNKGVPNLNQGSSPSASSDEANRQQNQNQRARNLRHGDRDRDKYEREKQPGLIKELHGQTDVRSSRKHSDEEFAQREYT